MTDGLTESLRTRFGDIGEIPAEMSEHPTLTAMAARGSCRAFQERAVADDVISTLCAIALSSPSKSDLQQRDIIILKDAAKKAAVLEIVQDQAWTAQVPVLLVFCGNNRRQRQVQEWRGRAFANDHLDAFFNASVDAGIALSAFVTAAEAAGLGTCPISTVRNQAQKVSDLLSLPDHVFPVAGLAVGYPAHPNPRISMRLPLSATVHVDGYNEDGMQGLVQAYDQARRAHRPFGSQRNVDIYGEDPEYGWSEDKARQYSIPERADFGAFVRKKGFKLD